MEVTTSNYNVLGKTYIFFNWRPNSEHTIIFLNGRPNIEHMLSIMKKQLPKDKKMPSMRRLNLH